MSTADEVVAALARRRLTVATAESLTGGLVAAELVGVPGASVVVRGGVVAYDTELKHRVLGVDAELLARRGPVDPDVAAQMARGVRDALRADAGPADVGLSTTGVAGPDPQGGQPPGTVFVAVALGDLVEVRSLDLEGDRSSVRHGSVDAVLGLLLQVLDGTGTEIGGGVIRPE